MASNVVRATLLADAQRFKAGFREGEQAVSGFEKLTGKASTLIKGYLGVQAARAVKDFAQDSIRAFSELEQSVGGTEAVFGGASKSIDDFAKTSATSIGLSESAFRTATTLIGGQLKRMTGDVDLAAEQSIVLAQVAADLAATYGGTTAEAVQALGSAFRGEADPAERFNLDLKIGAVNAKALELGLAESTSKVDANAKAQATLALIMEQSADAQGQFGREVDTVSGKTQIANAQLENNKALVGQALSSAYKNIAIPAVSAFGEVIGGLAEAFLILTGQMTTADSVLSALAAKWGGSDVTDVEKLSDVVYALERRFSNAASGVASFERELVNAFTSGEFNIEQLEGFRDLLPQVARENELTAEQQDALTEALESGIAVQEQYNIDLARGRGRSEEYAAALKGQKIATDETEGAQEGLNADIKTGIELTREAHDANRAATDALFAVREATNSQAEAQKVVNDLVNDGKQDTPEYIQALEDLSGANADLKDAQIRLIEQGGLTRDEFVNQQITLGLTREQAERLADVYNDLFTPRNVTHTITVNSVSKGNPGRVPGQAGGGFVLKGNTYEVNDDDNIETFTPQVNGRVGQNTSEKWGGGNGGGNTVINFNITPQPFTDPNANAKALVEYLERYRRINGRFPWEGR